MPRGDLMMHGQDIMLMVCDQAEQETIWKKMVR